MSRRRETALGIIGLVAGLATAPVLGAETPATSRSLVVTYFATPQNWQLYETNDDDCPDGFTQGLNELTLPFLSAAERERFKSGINGMVDTVANVNRNSPDMCARPWAFEDPPVETVQGRLARGMNLDGSDGDAPNVCRHENFTSPVGETGIDNQFYRVLGCVHGWRPKPSYLGGHWETFHVGARRSGETTTVIEITGVDDERNDASVEVNFYASADATVFDTQNRGLPFVSYTATDDPKYRARAHGRIKDGVLETDPADVRLAFSYGVTDKEHTGYYLRGARLRLELKPDGTAKGMIGGYFDVDTAFATYFNSRPGPFMPRISSSFGWSCPAVYQALHDLADGYPDETGKCTAISTAYDIEAVTAFTIQPKAKTAEAR